MLTRLNLLDDEVRAGEARVAAARSLVARHQVAASNALHRRLARADSLAAAGGAGVLYGLWVTRPCAGRPARPALPSWLVRAALSGAVSWLLSTPVTPEADES